MFAIEHVGIIVKDLEVSVRFYTALFNEPPIEQTSWRGSDAEYVGRLVGRPGLTLDEAFFRLPGTDTILEVGQFHNISDGEGVANRHYQTRSVHLGFSVDSIDGAVQRIQNAGGSLSTPVEIAYGPYKGQGGRTATFTDPDGITLQVMEIANRPGGLPVPSLRRRQRSGIEAGS
jgi:catechol 2,3-dioxygenase-like lactoylglutathione lyase family enzyme